MQDIALIKEKVAPEVPKIDFYAEASAHIQSLANSGRAKTAQCYRRSLNALAAFLDSSAISLDSITPQMLRTFIDSLRDKVSENTARGYIAEIRVLYNVVAEHHDITSNPFKSLTLARQSGRGLRALTSRQIRKIATLEGLPKAEAMARDLFLLSFCLCGVNMCDLYTMAKPSAGRICYERQKTRRRRKDCARVSLALHPFAQVLASRYLASPLSPYWLKFIQEYNTEESFLRAINNGLHEVGRRACLPLRLTSYYARHSWASIARNECDIDIYDISQALAHQPPNGKTDFIYIKEDSFRIDRANALVLSKVFKPLDVMTVAS